MHKLWTSSGLYVIALTGFRLVSLNCVYVCVLARKRCQSTSLPQPRVNKVRKPLGPGDITIPGDTACLVTNEVNDSITNAGTSQLISLESPVIRQKPSNDVMMNLSITETITLDEQPKQTDTVSEDLEMKRQSEEEEEEQTNVVVSKDCTTMEDVKPKETIDSSSMEDVQVIETKDPDEDDAKMEALSTPSAQPSQESTVSSNREECQFVRLKFYEFGDHNLFGANNETELLHISEIKNWTSEANLLDQIWKEYRRVAASSGFHPESSVFNPDDIKGFYNLSIGHQKYPGFIAPKEIVKRIKSYKFKKNIPQKVCPIYFGMVWNKVLVHLIGNNSIGEAFKPYEWYFNSSDTLQGIENEFTSFLRCPGYQIQKIKLCTPEGCGKTAWSEEYDYSNQRGKLKSTKIGDLIQLQKIHLPCQIIVDFGNPGM